MPRRKSYKPNNAEFLKLLKLRGKEGSCFTVRLSDSEEKAWLLGFEEYLNRKIIGIGFDTKNKAKLRKESLIKLLTDIVDREIISADEFWRDVCEEKIPENLRYLVSYADDNVFGWESIVKQIQTRVYLTNAPQHLEFDVSGLTNNYKTLTWFKYQGEHNFKLT